ncbi:cation-transporting P-type ATPase, partial [Pseudomonas sp. GD04158]|nr:cation-transporting P-type ATPase [Pseudomonas sp. GD04158]
MSRCCDHSHEPVAGGGQPVGHEHHAAPQLQSDEALGGTFTTRIRIEQMDCPTEERLLRDALGKVPGVAALHFNLLQRVLTVGHDEGALTRVLPAI